jgi:hypothetical protein
MKNSNKKSRSLNTRRLQIESLESRELLSVNPLLSYDPVNNAASVIAALPEVQLPAEFASSSTERAAVTTAALSSNKWITLIRSANYVELLPVNYSNTLSPNDDLSTDRISLGFTLDFYGKTYSQCYINNNGNITFEYSTDQYVSEGFDSYSSPMIAPFWADVDTRGINSNSVHWTTGISSRGNKIFQVDWRDVGYYEKHSNKLNDFTLYIEDDPNGTIVAFVYRNMDWIHTDTSTNAEIGFTTGDAEHYFSYFRPSSKADLAQLANKRVVFRLAELSPLFYDITVYDTNGDNTAMTNEELTFEAQLGDNVVSALNDEGWKISSAKWYVQFGDGNEILVPQNQTEINNTAGTITAKFTPDKTQNQYGETLVYCKITLLDADGQTHSVKLHDTTIASAASAITANALGTVSSPSIVSSSNPLYDTNPVFVTNSNGERIKLSFETLLVADESDEAMEYIAHTWIYSKHAEKTNLNQYGWEVDKIFDPWFGGFYAEGLVGTNAQGEKVALLACQGTNDIASILSDLNDKGVGYDQYKKMKSDIVKWFSEKVNEGYSISLTGHSLGGALAQWFAMDWINNYNKPIKSLVTFQSPGIAEGALNVNVKGATVKHFVAAGDVVSMSGLEFIPGNVYLCKIPAENVNTILDLHSVKNLSTMDYVLISASQYSNQFVLPDSLGTFSATSIAKMIRD